MNTINLRLASLLGLLASPLTPFVSAQDAVPTPLAAEIANRIDLAETLRNGGVLMAVLAAMSVVALALVVYFFLSLNTRRIAPSSFAGDIGVMLKHSRFREARQLCERNPTPASAIALAALNYVERSDEPDTEMLREVIEGEGVRQAARLQTQITYLMDLGVIAPMVGLLGTVWGMLRSFSAVALDLARARPVELAGGVSQALITTAAGLVVAIPTMVFYAYFRGRVAKVTANLEVVATEVATSLIHRKSVS